MTSKRPGSGGVFMVILLHENAKPVKGLFQATFGVRLLSGTSPLA
jgi:hypothetical protein